MDMDMTHTRRQSQPIADDVMDDDSLYETRMPSSVRRYKTSSIAQRSTADEPISQQGAFIQRRRSGSQPTQGIASKAVAPARERSEQRRFPLVPTVIGMTITIILIMSFSLASTWWSTYQDDLHYGRPRTSQMDAVVGHGDSASNPTHFIFMNLRRHVQIIEIPGGDPSRSRIFIGPTLYGDGQDLTPVTGEIRDINGDGKPDLIVHIQNQQVIFINDGTTFHSQ
jgi:hypothetical protein